MSFVKDNYESFMKELFLDIYIVMTECKTENQALQAVERTKALYTMKIDGFLASIKPLVESLASETKQSQMQSYIPVSLQSTEEDEMDCLELLDYRKQQKECCCCLDVLREDVVYGLRCSHAFHKTCMQQLQKFNHPCPYCSKALK